MVLSPCRVLKEVKMLAYVALLQDTVSYPHGTFTMTLPKILGVTYHQNFASLGTSTSHMDTYCLSNS